MGATYRVLWVHSGEREIVCGETYSAEHLAKAGYDAEAMAVVGEAEIVSPAAVAKKKGK